MPWERIDKATSWLAGITKLWAEDVPDVRADITLGTYRRLIEGLPLEIALRRAVTEARNNVVRNRICGLTGAWEGLYRVQMVAPGAVEVFTREVLGRRMYGRVVTHDSAGT